MHIADFIVAARHLQKKKFNIYTISLLIIGDGDSKLFSIIYYSGVFVV